MAFIPGYFTNFEVFGMGTTVVTLSLAKETILGLSHMWSEQSAEGTGSGGGGGVWRLRISTLNQHGSHSSLKLINNLPSCCFVA